MPADRSLPSLSQIIEACAAGQSSALSDAIGRHSAAHRDDPGAAFLLRFVAAVAGDADAAREALAVEAAALKTAVAVAERGRSEAEEEMARLTAKLAQQAATLDKLAYVNEALERQQRELLASRWRKLGLRLGLAKRASFEA
jgi:hypothetical protein